MNQASYFEQKRFSPGSLAMVLGVHAAFITAAIAWKVDVVRLVDPPLVITPIRPDRIPPPEPEQTEIEPRPRPDNAIIPPTPIPRLSDEPGPTGIVDEPPPLNLDDLLPKPPLPEPAPIQQSARARGDVRTLITPDDYPESARRQEETGTVRAKLEISTSGRVTGCTIVTTSGSAALDATTCRVLKARARFTPARDSSGQPVSDSYVTPRIVWRIDGRG